MNKIINPNMVILAREYRGYSQKELAEKLEVTPPIVSRIENGLFQVSDEMLDKLSLQLVMPKNFFYEPISISPLGIHFYRKAKGIPQKILSSLNAEINIDSLRIEKLLQAAKITVDNIPYIDPESNIDKFKTSADIAIALRYAWKIPKGHIENLVEILENAGVIVILSPYNTRFFDAVSFSTKSGRYIIFANSLMSGDRLRFSLAHELGHIVMHRFPYETIEDEANDFASEFLMPKSDIKHYLSNLTFESLANLKRYWKVSMQAILVRANRLGEITNNQYRYLWMQMAKLGYKLQEPIDIPQEQPSLLSELIKLHIQEYGYSDEELKCILYLSDDEYHKYNSSAIIPLRVISTIKNINNQGN
jgi:Zn-dependent peptidase ImmA (M78 family)/DNA-binding XRE family transcriptional regulator